MRQISLSPRTRRPSAFGTTSTSMFHDVFEAVSGFQIRLARTPGPNCVPSQIIWP
jgi:hypothetical protein